MQWRCSLCCLAFLAFFGVNLISEELLRSEDGPREPSPSFNGLRAQPSAELFKGTYSLRINASSQKPGAEYWGKARMTLGTQPTSVLGMQVSSIALTLEGVAEDMRGIAPKESVLRGSGSGLSDVDLILRGVDLLDVGQMTASGVSQAFAGLRNQQHPEHPEMPASAEASAKGSENDLDVLSTSRKGPRPCYLDATLARPGAAVQEVPYTRVGEKGEVQVVKHTHGFAGHAASVDCGFSLNFALHNIDVQHIGGKVLHYAIWVSILTMVQMWCFISQMRYTDEGPSAARLSIIGITVQALMDAYDSFLHLSLTASSQYMFNTFAMISLTKFILFSLLEVRYVLTIWRCQNREIFAAGWDEVRRHVSQFHSYFHGTLFAGLLVIFNCLDYLDVFVLIFQVYWVPQIVHDIFHGSKASFQPRFLLGISATRSLSLIYLWGCPATIFSGDLYPALPHAPSMRFCITVVLLQVLQLGVMLSQQKLGPRWFVPRAFLPHVYNYQRVAMEAEEAECVICMGELGNDGSQAAAITPCDHMFHSACLERWMDIKMECPTCRTPLPPMS